jgi:hypothetical protein
MTTESQQDTTRRPGVTVLLGTAAVALVAGGALVLVGALADGAPAAYGALVGVGLALAVLLGGALVVDLVASLLPAASLLVALLTYTLEVVVMALVFVGLSGSGLLDATLSRGWLGAGVIATTLVWLVGQVLLTTRARIPAYDLPPTRPASDPAVRPSATGAAGVPERGEAGAR